MLILGEIRYLDGDGEGGFLALPFAALRDDDLSGFSAAGLEAACKLRLVTLRSPSGTPAALVDLRGILLVVHGGKIADLLPEK